MTEERKKLGLAFWATVVVAGLFLYVLSIGPWFWIVTGGHIPLSLVWIDHIYDPLRWIIDRSPVYVGDAGNSYLSLWLPAKPFEYHGE